MTHDFPATHQRRSVDKSGAADYSIGKLNDQLKPTVSPAMLFNILLCFYVLFKDNISSIKY
jgi:hypothetical protein